MSVRGSLKKQSPHQLEAEFSYSSKVADSRVANRSDRLGAVRKSRTRSPERATKSVPHFPYLPYSTPL